MFWVVYLTWLLRIWRWVHVLTLVSSISAINSKICFVFIPISTTFKVYFHPVVHVQPWNFFLNSLLYLYQLDETHQFSTTSSGLPNSNVLLKAAVSLIYCQVQQYLQKQAASAISLIPGFLHCWLICQNFSRKKESRRCRPVRIRRFNRMKPLVQFSQ